MRLEPLTHDVHAGDEAVIQYLLRRRVLLDHLLRELGNQLVVAVDHALCDLVKQSHMAHSANNVRIRFRHSRVSHSRQKGNEAANL